MRGTSWLRTAVLAGAGLLWQTGGLAQEYGTAGDPYLQGSGGEACPPLVAPAPYPAPSMDGAQVPPPPSDIPANEEAAPPPPSAPTLDDFPRDSDMFPNQPMQQPNFAPPPSAPSFVSAAPGPQSISPNMIGDLFGVSGGSSLTFTTNSFHARGFFRNRTSGDIAYFPATNGGGWNIELTGPTAFDIIGDATGTIPAGSVWESAHPVGPVPPYPHHFDLAENADETAATSAAYPSATAVTFVDGDATQNPDPGSHDEYAIFTDYLIDAPATTTIVLPNPGAAPGAIIGRQKIAENSSPIPRSRVFVNYSYFDNTPLSRTGVDVNRVTPGFEYAFYDSNLSIEVRAPFASTLSSDLIAGGVTGTSEIEFGNVTAYFKALMMESDTFSWSAGVGVTAPTADDVTVSDPDGIDILRIENEGVHLLPFLGFLYTPSERCFMQGFLQYDVDLTGNPVYFTSFDEGDATGHLSRIGRAQDSTYAFIDLGIGYWIYRNRHCDGFINGLAPTLEIHYNAATDNSDTINRTFRPGDRDGVDVQVGTPGDLEVTNVVLGLNAIIGDSGTLTIGYSRPVAGDDQFDGEFRAFFNWYFGPVPGYRNGVCSCYR